MKNTKLVISLIFALSCALLTRGQIVGQDAQFVRDMAQFPSQVLIETRSGFVPQNMSNREERIAVNKYISEKTWKFQGGGTILNKQWVLTAAHLFASYEYVLKGERNTLPGFEGKTMKLGIKTDAVRVMVGQLMKTEESWYHKVEHVRMHPHYFGQGQGNDIALVQMKDFINFGSARVNTLPLAPVNPTERLNMDCKIVGWGRNSMRRDPDGLMRWANTQVVSNEPFRKTPWLVKDLIMVGTPMGGTSRFRPAGHLKGDSGSGLICRYHGNDYVFGVTQSCFTLPEDVSENYYGSEYVPSMYTNVFHHRRWIKQEMWKPAPEGSSEWNLISAYAKPPVDDEENWNGGSWDYQHYREY